MRIYISLVVMLVVLFAAPFTVDALSCAQLPNSQLIVSAGVNDSFGKNFYVRIKQGQIADHFILAEKTVNFYLPDNETWGQWPCGGRPAYPSLYEASELETRELHERMRRYTDGVYHLKVLGELASSTVDVGSPRSDQVMDPYVSVLRVQQVLEGGSTGEFLEFKNKRLHTANKQKWTAVAQTITAEVWSFLPLFIPVFVASGILASVIMAVASYSGYLHQRKKLAWWFVVCWIFILLFYTASRIIFLLI